MKTWSAFYPLVLPEVQGAPLPLVDSAIRQTTIDIMGSSMMYQASLPDITIVADTATYTPVPPAGYEIALMLEAWIEDRQLLQTAATDLATGYKNWRTETGTVEAYLSETPDTITLYRIPDSTTAGQLLKLRAALIPTQTSTGVEDWIFSGYAQQIADGTKAYLMRMPGAWGNPSMAQFYAAAYATHKNSARTDGKRNFGRASQTVRLQRF